MELQQRHRSLLRGDGIRRFGMKQAKRLEGQKTGNGTARSTSRGSVGEQISFYRANEKPYGAFSNLYKSKIVFEGVTYPTAEHAYQAGKAVKRRVRDWILAAPTPALAAMAAHNLYTWEVVPDWSVVKFDRMRAVLRAKFTQHADLQALLLSTGETRLVESGTVDNAINRLWGQVNGRGENVLGQMLMDLRSQLRAERKRASRPQNRRRA